MNNRPECLPCLLRRVLHTAELVTADEWLHRKILAEAMQELARADDLSTPAELIHDMARRATRTLGDPDPYGAEKRRWVEETTGNADLVRQAVESAADPFREALKFSLAANLLDCELREEIRRGFSLKSLLEEAPALSLPSESVEDLREAVGKARRILFVHDSAGELFFDRLLIERWGKQPSEVVSVVRESSILNDATEADARAVGLDQVARIVHPGISCLGIPLNACSQEFREEYSRAELVVAKGQACYETLEGKESQPRGEEKAVCFLLRVKCPVLARELGVNVGDCVLELA